MEQVGGFRNVAVISTFLCLTVLSAGCWSADQGSGQNLNAARLPESEGTSGGPMILRDRYDIVREYLVKDIADISRNLGLASLNRPGRKDDMELRIWTKLGGIVNAKLLGVRSSEGKYSAYFFETDGKTALAENRNLPAPRSPWTKMLFEVGSRLTTPKGLERDPNFAMIRDEPVIVLEVLDKGEYDLVFYGHFTTYEDGERLISVCEYLAGEFGVDPECGFDRDQR